MNDKIIINIEIPADQLRKVVGEAVREEIKRASLIRLNTKPPIESLQFFRKGGGQPDSPSGSGD